MVNVLKFEPLLFSNIMLVIRAGIHKMLVRIANREDPDQTALLILFWQATSVQNLRTFSVISTYS